MKKLLFVLTGLVMLGWALPALAERVYVTDENGRIHQYEVYQPGPFTTKVRNCDTMKQTTIKRFPPYHQAVREWNAWDPQGGYYRNGGSDGLLLDLLDR